MTKISNTILNTINYICVSVGLIFLSIQLRAFDINYYQSQFEKNNTRNITGKSYEELNDIADSLIKYLILGDNKLIEPYFSSKEILHMVDVYNLFKMMFIVEILIIIILLGIYFYGKQKRSTLRLAINLRNNIFITYFLVFIVSILFLNIDFTQAFIYFHEIFFSNDLWILNPKTDLMIQMLPEEFFSRMALEIFILWIGLNILLQIILTVLVIRNNKN